MSKLNVNEMGFNSMMEHMYKTLYGDTDTETTTSSSIMTLPKELLDESATAHGYKSSIVVNDFGYFLATAPDPTIADSQEKKSNSQLYAPVFAAVVELTHNIEVVASKWMICGTTLTQLTFSVLKRGGSSQDPQDTLQISNSVEIKNVNVKSLLLNERANKMLLTFSYEQLMVTNFVSDKKSIQQGMVKSLFNKVTGAAASENPQ